MSEQHMHVHGAHDHEVEHQAQHGPGLAQQVAIFTAILSTIGAVVAYLGAATQNEAMLLKNEAVLKKAEDLDKESHKMNESSDHALHPLHKLEQALTLIQIAIALGSITALTRKRWLFLTALVAAARRPHPVRHRAGALGSRQ